MTKAMGITDVLARRAPLGSQATSIEQSRAIAEVQAMVVVAMRNPRDEPRAIGKVKEVCRQASLAKTAFFKYSRGDGTVTGVSIKLATELARCWGNINYGVAELARNDAAGESEMLAFAWDVETNVRNSTTFIVPHKRDKKGGPVDLVDMRDIYENNANNAARRLREMILRALPSWLVEDAKGYCYHTLETGEGEVPLAKRIMLCIDRFQAIGISRERVEAKMGTKADVFTPVDLANLAISLESLKRKEIDADEEFPGVKSAALTAVLAGNTTGAKLNAPTPTPEPTNTSSEPKSDLPPLGEEEAEALFRAAVQGLAKINDLEELEGADASVKSVLASFEGKRMAWAGYKLTREKQIRAAKK